MTSEVGIDSTSVVEASGGGNKGEGVPLKKGRWTKAEDAILMDYVTKYGKGSWSSVHRRTGLARSGKSCRMRWANHLKPDLKKGAFTPEEEELIIKLHAKIGNKWARIAAEFPGRADNDIKNFWYARLKRQRRAEKYMDPPGSCLQESNEDKQNKELELTTSSSANSDPALLPIDSVEIPTVEFNNDEPSQQLYPSELLNIGSGCILDIPTTSLQDQGLNSSWNTRSISPTVHLSKRVRESESWFSDPKVDLSQAHHQYRNDNSLFTQSLGFSSSYTHNLTSNYHHAPLYGNPSSSESKWEPNLELPLIQTPLDNWVSPCSVPSLQSSYTLIQTPPNEYTDLCSLSPRSSGLLNGILYGSQTFKASTNNSHQETSRDLVPDSFPALRTINWGTNTNAISPSGHSITLVLNEYTPSSGGSLEEHQSLEPLIGYNVNQEMANLAPTARNDDTSNHHSFSGTDWYFDPTVWPHNRMG